MKPMLSLLVLLFGLSSGQAQVSPLNPSFEGTPAEGKDPEGWHSCGDYTTPDILPGPWDVLTRAYKGNTYLGLITRSEGTWESVGQQLTANVKKNECYHFSVALARGTTYAGYNNPVRFRLWGGTSKCHRKQLLAESAAIEHREWKVYDFFFFPDEDYSFIVIEPFYKDGKNFPYSGNILIDDLSKFVPCTRADAGEDLPASH